MYTISIKRRFWFGSKTYQVTGHNWDNFRFILNLIDGSQLHVPGFLVPSLKIGADFWVHLQQLAPTQPAFAARAFEPSYAAPSHAAPSHAAPSHAAPVEPSHAAPVEPSHAAPVEEPFEDYSHIAPEVLNRAAQRVRGILQSAGQQGPLEAGPSAQRPLPTTHQRPN